MSQKLVQSQSMQQVQTLSPQQVLQVRLLEMPVSELEQRVKNELIDNGALEESLGSPEDADTSSEDVYDGTDAESAGIETSGLDGGLPSDEYRPAEVRQAMDDYRTPDDVPDYLLQERGGKDRPETMDYGDTTSFYEQMTEQMNECDLTPREQELMTYLIGSLENDGLLKKKLSTLADELEIYAGIQTTEAELETVLARLQTFDPPGIGARDLRECLLLQLRRDEHRGSRQKQLEYEIIDKLFDGGITLSFNKGDVPELRISPSFMEILHQVDTGRAKMSRPEREALQYTRQKIEKAQGFIEAVKQRRRTLTAVMQAIIDLQRPFFLEGDETLLRPMILKDVAERTGLDISTVSRAANSKYVETHYGTYPLKWFFSDGYVTDDGQEIATRKIQAALKDLVEAEDKKKPLSDEALTAMLNEKGFPIARRTVAKYREQLGIPVARLRK